LALHNNQNVITAMERIERTPTEYVVTAQLARWRGAEIVLL
jgi:hypothetical protein